MRVGLFTAGLGITCGLAKAMAAGLSTTTPALAPHLVDDFPGFDPTRPGDPAAFALP